MKRTHSIEGEGEPSKSWSGAGEGAGVVRVPKWGREAISWERYRLVEIVIHWHNRLQFQLNCADLYLHVLKSAAVQDCSGYRLHLGLFRDRDRS